MTFEQLIAYIETYIFTNTDNAITGDVMQDVLKEISAYFEDKNIDVSGFVEKDENGIIANVPLVFYEADVKQFRIYTNSGIVYFQTSDDNGETWVNVLVFNTSESSGIQKRFTTKNYIAPADDIDAGAVVSYAAETKIVTVADKEYDSSITGKVVEFVDTNLRYYALINGAEGSTFSIDAVPAFEPTATATYRILNTFEIDINDVPVVNAFDLISNLNDCAVLMPYSLEAIEREQIINYIEKGNGHRVVIMFREDEYALGSKYITLEGFQETLGFMPHQWILPHFDVIFEKNIMRKATGYYNDSKVAINGGDWALIQPANKITFDFLKRFDVVTIEGQDKLMYKSLLGRLFNVFANIIVTKTGAAGDCSIAVEKYTAETDTTEVIETRIGRSYFGAGTGTQILTLCVPVELKIGDTVALVGKEDGGTYAIQTGSHLTICD
jgi:hypothetical protein